jgi:hypothetical protein
MGYGSPMVRRAFVVVLALAGFACNRRHVDSDTPPSSSTAGATSSGSSAMSSSRLHVRPISAGYGGVGPATPPPYPDTWVVLFVGVETTAKVTGVFVKQLEIVDATGAVVARGIAPFSLRREGARQRGDFSEQGTTPFDGLAEPGRDLRLRIGAPLDTRAERLVPRPVRVRALIQASSDPGIWVDAPLQGPWPAG